MKVLITGGTGFLGRHTALRLVERGVEVTALGRNDQIGSQLEQLGIAYRKVSLEDKNTVVMMCEGYDAVVHCAGLASPSGTYESFYQANVVGTQNVIAGCLNNSVPRLVHLSTPSLYFDYRDRLNIKENDPLPLRPATHYAATKLLADEEVARAKRQGLQTISLRPRGIIGPGDENVLGRLINAAQKGIIPLIGGGKSYVDLTYIDNTVDAILLALEAPEKHSGKIYNITNGEPIQTKDLMDKLFSRLEFNPRRIPMPFAVAHTLAAAMEKYYEHFKKGQEPPLTRYAVGLMSKSQTLNITAAKTDLGYRPKINLDQALTHYTHWWKRVHKEKTTGLEALGLVGIN